MKCTRMAQLNLKGPDPLSFEISTAASLSLHLIRSESLGGSAQTDSRTHTHTNKQSGGCVGQLLAHAFQAALN